jgi:hypothetical protein
VCGERLAMRAHQSDTAALGVGRGRRRSSTM